MIIMVSQESLNEQQYHGEMTMVLILFFAVNDLFYTLHVYKMLKRP